MGFMLGDTYKNIPRITTQDLKRLLPFYIVKSFYGRERRTPLMVHGYFGEGKTEIVKRICEEVADELGARAYHNTRYWEVDGRRLHLNTLMASGLDPSETKGMPDVREVAGAKVTEWALPWWWVPEGAGPDVYFVLFLDELNCAQTFQWTTLREAVNSGVLGGVRCARKSAFLAAVNPPEYSSDVQQELSLPFLNRFCHLYVDSDYGDWREWALGGSDGRVGEYVSLAVSSAKHGLSGMRIDPRIVAFHEMHRGAKLREVVTESDRDRHVAVPTPRSWHMASELIRGVPTKEDTIDLLTLLVASAVGMPVAMEFRAFLELYRELGDPNVVLDDPERFFSEVSSKPREKRIGLTYIAVFAVSDFIRSILGLPRRERDREFGKVVRFLKASKPVSREIPAHEMLLMMTAMIPGDSKTELVDTLGYWKARDKFFSDVLFKSAEINLEVSALVK